MNWIVWHHTRLNCDAAGGVEKHILGLKNAFEKNSEKKNIRIFVKPLDETFEELARMPDNRIIIHTHGDLWPSKKLLLSKRSNVKWIHVCHGNSFARLVACKEFFSLSGWKGSLKDFLLVQAADALVAVAPHAKKETDTYFGLMGLKPFLTKVISNGADAQLFKPLKKVAQNKEFIFLGRSKDKVKNFITLLRAAKKVHEKHTDFVLKVAPAYEGPKLPFLRSMEKLDGAQLTQALADSRALVLVSFYEGNPLVVQEAMSIGLPMVLSDIPGNREAVKNYEAVKWVNPHSTSSLVRAMNELIADEFERKPMPSQRSWNEASQEYQSFYETLFTETK